MSISTFSKMSKYLFYFMGGKKSCCWCTFCSNVQNKTPNIRKHITSLLKTHVLLHASMPSAIQVHHVVHHVAVRTHCHVHTHNMNLLIRPGYVGTAEPCFQILGPSLIWLLVLYLCNFPRAKQSDLYHHPDVKSGPSRNCRREECYCTYSIQRAAHPESKAGS